MWPLTRRIQYWQQRRNIYPKVKKLPWKKCFFPKKFFPEQFLRWPGMQNWKLCPKRLQQKSYDFYAKLEILRWNSFTKKLCANGLLGISNRRMQLWQPRRFFFQFKYHYLTHRVRNEFEKSYFLSSIWNPIFLWTRRKEFQQFSREFPEHCPTSNC